MFFAVALRATSSALDIRALHHVRRHTASSSQPRQLPERLFQGCVQLLHRGALQVVPDELDQALIGALGVLVVSSSSRSACRAAAREPSSVNSSRSRQRLQRLAQAPARGAPAAERAWRRPARARALSPCR